VADRGIKWGIVVRVAVSRNSSGAVRMPLRGRWPMSPEMEIKNRVLDFARKHADTWLKLDLLCFWSKYPYAKLTVGIIARALSCKRRVDVEEALDSFVNESLVDRRADNGLLFYSLTSDADKRDCVLNMPAYRSSLRPTLSVG
jgi:hypothetical protein